MKNKFPVAFVTEVSTKKPTLRSPSREINEQMAYDDFVS